jgi:hypothetical protein
MALTKVTYAMIEGSPINAVDFGADPTGVNDSQPAFQAAIDYLNSVGGGTLKFYGTFRLNSQISNIGSNITIDGNGSSKIINGITSGFGTADALFRGTGSVTNAGTVPSGVSGGQRVVTVSTPSNFAVGDVVTFQGDFIGRNSSVVIGITGSDLELDRVASNAIPAGNIIYKVNSLKNTNIGNFFIDFNGTTDAPRYGYGVYFTYAKDCLVENINSINIGSKVVEFQQSVDCMVSNVKCTYGTFVGGEGGHSYLVRFSVCNDCVAERCVGNYLRHTLDATGASRNTFRNSQANYNWSASFLTHGNNCLDNIFTNNTSIGSGVAAYAFDTSNGDVGNVVDGGYIEDDVVLYFAQNDSNTVQNLTVKSHGTRAALTFNGVQTFQNCTFISSNALITGQTATTNLTFIGCRFKTGAANAIASLSLNTQNITLNFNACKIDSLTYEGTILAGGSNTIVNITGCELMGPQTVTIAAMIDGVTKEINAYESTFAFFGTGGVYFFGANTNTTITIDGCRFINSTQIVRRYTAGNVSMVIGQNQYINSSLESGNFSNWNNLRTIGAVDIGTNAAPTGGNWAAGAKILYNTPPAGGNIGAVCTTTGSPGTWKDFGAIAA